MATVTQILLIIVILVILAIVFYNWGKKGILIAMAHYCSPSEKKKTAIAYDQFDDDNYLPVEILQRIQYFLHGGTLDCSVRKADVIEETFRVKEVARASILSKSWYYAWSTDIPPPILTLSNLTVKDFANFARRSIQRYKDSNVNLQCLVLVLNIGDGCTNKLVDELIADSSDLGLNELHIRICDGTYVLPARVLETTTLTKLSLAKCRVKTGRVLCSHLDSLSLQYVDLAGGILNDIFSVCDSIQNITVGDVRSPGILYLSKLRNVVNLSLSGNIASSAEFMDPAGSGINAPQYRNLTSMRLIRPFVLDDSFFTQFSCLFPCLEDFLLANIFGCNDIQISSESLKYLELCHGGKMNVRLNVPNIQKLTFSVSHVPSLSLITKSKEWETHVNWVHESELQVSEWRNFLKELRNCESQVHLRFRINLANTIWEEDTPIFLTPPVMENNMKVDLSTWLSSNNLSVDFSMYLSMFRIDLSKWSLRVNCSSLLGGLFKICRPRFVTLDKYCTQLCKDDIPMLLKLISDTSFLHKKDEYTISIEEDELMRLASLCLVYGLQDVNMALLDENLEEWRTIPLGKPIDVSSVEDIIKDQQIRLHFIWGGVRQPAAPVEQFQPH